MCVEIYTKLSKKKEFDNVFLKGKTAFNSILGIKTTLNNLKQNRFGIIVSTKISKKAVDRNKIKRQIREIIKEVEQNTKKGNDIIFITLPLILGKNFKEIKKSIKKNLYKLKIFKN